MDELKKKIDNYELETKKHAIWDDLVTKGFIAWLKGEKLYDKDKKRISFYVNEEVSNKWQDYMENHKEYSTLSKLIRAAVNNFIEQKQQLVNSQTLSKLSHDLKQPLTAIKGFSQLLLEKPHKSQLSEGAYSIVKNIFESSKQLETKLKEMLEDNPKIDILLIEDDDATIKLLTAYFKGKGVNCKGVIGSARAMEILNNSEPKLILLDIILPDKTGTELCKEIKSIKKFENIPIYFLTGLSESEVKKKTKEAGAKGYILKPFDFANFEALFKYLK